MSKSMKGCASKLWFLLLAAAGCGGSEQDQTGMQGATQQAGVGGMSGIAGTGGVSGASSAGMGGAAGTGIPLAGASGAGGVGGTDVAGSGGSTPQIPEGACLDCPIPPECQGFAFKGIRYSPGGTTLPNSCEPFHATLNNPYAVRCTDVYPAFDSGFPGDEYCVLPPPPELGMQVGLHPQGTPDQYWEQIWAGDYSGYQNAGDEWVIEAGGEITQNYRGHSTNTEEKNYYRRRFPTMIASLSDTRRWRVSHARSEAEFLGA